MSGVVRKVKSLFWNASSKKKETQKQPDLDEKVAVVVQAAAEHPQPFQFIPGNKPPVLPPPEEYRFHIPQGPTGFARFRHYWNAHWREVARRFLHPIRDLRRLIEWARSLWQPKRQAAQAFKEAVGKKKKAAAEDRKAFVDETAEEYGPVIARVLEKEFLNDQNDACELLGKIIIYHSVHAMEKKRATKLFRVALTADYLEERLDALLPVLTKTMHMKPFITAQGKQSIGWRDYGYQKFEKNYGHDPLAFREKIVIFIVEYLTTMVPIVNDLYKNEKDQGALREALEEHGFLPEQTLAQCLATSLRKALGRCKTREEQLLLEGLADVLVEFESEVDDALDELLEKLVGSRALDSYIASVLKLDKGKEKDRSPAQKPEKEKADESEDISNVLTDAEADAIYKLEATIVESLSKPVVGKKVAKLVGKATAAIDYYFVGFVGRALGRLVEHDNIEYRMCRLNLTQLLPALREAVKKAESPGESQTDYTEKVNEYFKSHGSKVAKKLRKRLRTYPLLLDNLARLVIYYAIKYFLVDTK